VSYSNQIANVWTSYLDSEGYHYSFDREKGLIRLTFSSDCKAGDRNILIVIRESDYFVFNTLDIHADKQSRPVVAELMTRINYTRAFTNFEMDFSDGEMRIRNCQDCENCLPSREVVRNSLGFVLTDFTRYADKILGVMYGFMTVEQAMQPEPTAPGTPTIS